MATRLIPARPEFVVQLRRTQHAVRTRLDAELAATGLTTPQYAVLAAIDREVELSASELAREFGMSAQTLNVLVKALETSGLLCRSAHPTHGRILLASLTPAGKRALKRGIARATRVQEQLLAGLAGPERKSLMEDLKAIEEAARPADVE
jgi:DNA-binding MarR family transcriptional regulator